jgi:hypothetical protein
MPEKSFRRAALFGVLGSLVFYIVAALIVHFFPSLKRTLLFRTDTLQFDLVLISVSVRLSLFVIIGFAAGWAFCLFRRAGGGVKRNVNADA